MAGQRLARPCRPPPTLRHTAAVLQRVRFYPYYSVSSVGCQPRYSLTDPDYLFVYTTHLKYKVREISCDSVVSAECIRRVCLPGAVGVAAHPNM